MGRKPIADERKWSQLRIRLTDAERAALDRAAGPIGTSTWARSVLLAEAERLKAAAPKRKAARRKP